MKAFIYNYTRITIRTFFFTVFIMPEAPNNDISEVKKTRNQAEFIRAQLQAEYNRLTDEMAGLAGLLDETSRYVQGREAMRKAIAAADTAIDAIDQYLREMARVRDENPES